MDLRHIRYVVAIAERGSFTRAAEAAFVTQPTLSAAIAGLEAELGVVLFERGRKGAKLTEAGDRFLPRARAMLREVEAARAEARSVKPIRPLRIGLLSTVPWSRLARAVEKLARGAAGASWRIETGTADEIDAALLAGRIDVALTRIGRAKGVETRLLFEDQQGLAMPIGEGPRGLTPAFLDGKRLIVRTHCEDLFAASRILDRWKVKPVVVHRTTRDEQALDLVAAGFGYCLMPTSFARAGVVIRPSSAVKLRRRIGAAWTRDGWGGRIAALAETLDRSMS